MSCLRMGKKFQPARKVWKGLTSTLQIKLGRLKRLKALRKTTQRLNTTILSLLACPRRPSPHLRRRKQASTRPNTSLRVHQPRRVHRSNLSPVYIDDLFKAPVSVPVKVIEPPSSKKAEKEKGAPSDIANESGSLAQTSAPSAYGSRFPVLSGVDERAEQFIAEFRKEMRLQRQRSFTEYQEMLERGVM